MSVPVMKPLAVSDARNTAAPTSSSGRPKAVHGGVGEDLLAALGWGAVVFKEQAAVLLGGEEARGDGVDPYAFVGPLSCEELG